MTVIVRVVLFMSFLYSEFHDVLLLATNGYSFCKSISSIWLSYKSKKGMCNFIVLEDPL